MAARKKVTAPAEVRAGQMRADERALKPGTDPYRGVVLVGEYDEVRRKYAVHHQEGSTWTKGTPRGATGIQARWPAVVSEGNPLPKPMNWRARALAAEKRVVRLEALTKRTMLACRDLASDMEAALTEDAS